MSASPSTAHAAATSREPHQDVLQLLMAEHREVKTMFQQYQKLADTGGKGDERMLLASQICVALTVHTQMEEELLYPAAREVLTKDEDLVDEAYVEHAGAKSLIAQIKTMTSDQPLFDAKVKVLGEYIDHHVKEEESEFFPKLRQTVARSRGDGRPHGRAQEAADGAAGAFLKLNPGRAAYPKHGMGYGPRRACPQAATLHRREGRALDERVITMRPDPV